MTLSDRNYSAGSATNRIYVSSLCINDPQKCSLSDKKVKPHLPPRAISRLTRRVARRVMDREHHAVSFPEDVI